MKNKEISCGFGIFFPLDPVWILSYNKTKQQKVERRGAMRRLEENFRRKAAVAAALGFLTAVLPLLFRRLLGIRAGRTRFAGQEAGFLAWEGRRGKFLFCSTHYAPGWNIGVALPAGCRAVLCGLAGLCRDRRAGKSMQDCKK